MIYTVTLNPALDYILSAESFSVGQVNRAAATAVTFGGKGINQSVMLNNLGVRSLALGFAGGFTGQKLCCLLDEAGLCHRMTGIAGETRINLKIRGQKETEINAAGPVVSPHELCRLTESIRALSPGDVLSFGGSVPAGLDRSVIRDLTAAAPEGVLTVVDADGDTLALALAANPWLIKPNLHEAAVLLGEEDKAEKAETICRALREKGAQNVLLSMGGQGAALLWEGDFLQMAAPQGRVKGTTGAGDSLLAGFLVGLAQGRDPAGALHLAVAAGSATAFSGRIADGQSVWETENQMRMR